MSRKPVSSIEKVLGRLWVCLVVALPWVSFAAPSSITEGLDSLFTDLKSSYDKAASASILRSTKISPVNGYFIKILKNNQVIYALMRTNTKGTVINEVLRGEDPLTKKRDISTQPWFRAVTKKKRALHRLYEGGERTVLSVLGLSDSVKFRKTAGDRGGQG